jgi:hypothetical protein
MGCYTGEPPFFVLFNRTAGNACFRCRHYYSCRKFDWRLIRWLDKFLQKLIDQCYEKEVQDNVKTQLVALQTTAESIYGNSFRNCSQLQRGEMLLKFSVSTDEAEESFFKLIKSETIRGFNTSREVMVNHHRYKQVPGHFYGCADVNA